MERFAQKLISILKLIMIIMFLPIVVPYVLIENNKEKMISFILEKMHDLIHFFHLPRKFDFWFMRIKIKWDNRKSKCWKCKNFDSFYFDECTYDCKIDGTLMWGDEEYCKEEKHDV